MEFGEKLFEIVINCFHIIKDNLQKIQLQNKFSFSFAEIYDIVWLILDFLDPTDILNAYSSFAYPFCSSLRS